MSEIIDCPGCKRKLQVPDDVVGQRVQCPTCAAVFIPQAGTAPIPEPPPPIKQRTDNWEDPDFAPRSRSRRHFDDDDYDYDEEDDRSLRRRRRRDWAPHRGDLVLVLGILSIIVCPVILGQLAWIMGSADLADMDSGRMDPSGRSNTSIGRVLGIVSTCLFAVPAALGCFFLVVFGMLGAARF